MMTPFVAKPFGPDGTLYKSRVTGRRYLVKKESDCVRVFINGRCIYGGSSLDRAFGFIELDDCAA